MSIRVWSGHCTAQEPSLALRIQNPSLLGGPQDLAHFAPSPSVSSSLFPIPETPLPQSLPSLTSFEFCFLLTETLPNKFVFWTRILLCLVWTQLSLNSYMSACLCLQSEVCASTPGYKVTALGDGVKLGGRALAWGAHTGHTGHRRAEWFEYLIPHPLPLPSCFLEAPQCAVYSVISLLICHLLDLNSDTEVSVLPHMDAAFPASPRLSPEGPP